MLHQTLLAALDLLVFAGRSQTGIHCIIRKAADEQQRVDAQRVAVDILAFEIGVHVLVAGEHIEQEYGGANGQKQIDDEDDSAGDHASGAMVVRDDR